MRFSEERLATAGLFLYANFSFIGPFLYKDNDQNVHLLCKIVNTLVR